MDFPIQTHRVETAPLLTAALPHPNSDQLASQAETARPVMGADEAQKVRSSTVEPLDMYAVGDNDHIPVPPEPPRPSTVLAVIASATTEPEEAEVPEGQEATSSEAPTAKEPPISESLRQIEEGPENPTVDVRS